MRSQYRIKLAIALLSAGSFVGCSSFSGWNPPYSDSRVSDYMPGQSGQRSAADSNDVTPASYEAESPPTSRIGEDDGLEVEDFYPSNIGQTVKNLTGRGPDRELARDYYGEGDQLYRQALADRERDARTEMAKQFEQAAEKFIVAADRWPDSAMEEDSLFRAAESYFFADKFVKSNEQFELLLKKYPNTRYLDIVGARRFLIAEYWLQLEDSDPSNFWEFNLTDDKMPWYDTHGHAVRIFDRMRLDDPTGKLADDATIAAGNACLARRDFVKADQYYSDLRKTFPSSEHQFMAHFLGLKAKLSSYKGPDFASNSLEEAEGLIKQIRRQFPNEYRKHKAEINRAYNEIRYKLAEREWNMAEFYNGRSEFGAARFYYERIVKKFADTPFADRARTQIEVVAGEPLVPPQRLAWLVRLFPDPDRDPLIATSPNGTTVR